MPTVYSRTTYTECVVPIIEFQPVHLVCQVRSYSLLLIDTTFYDFERLNVGVRRSSMSGERRQLRIDVCIERLNVRVQTSVLSGERCQL
jgi:hypothetical protein